MSILNELLSDVTWPASRHYIALARQKRPTVPPQVSSYVVDSYVRLRKHSKEQEKDGKAYTYTSARTLLGVLRLSQALARLRFSDVVEHADVDEALRLMEVSKESLNDDNDAEREPDQTDMSKIFRIIKEMLASRGSGGMRRTHRRLGKGPSGERDMDIDDDDDEVGDAKALSIVDIRSRVLASGFTEARLMDTIHEVRCSLLHFERVLITLSYSTRISMSGQELPITQSYVSSTETTIRDRVPFIA